ncbi:hypothetical protein ATPR_1071 [Acetobacter tropicalis NBRC 101654]|uniref:Uncharacterized protein n=1 Tax=Acetobacter tropicalis NBRC 101654 TaxID=749388 RepID=F7VCH2_9PROT|nr:hypothetical protein ATPR_1071 [Acetobacter tropicalis NBRC 101654]
MAVPSCHQKSLLHPFLISLCFSMQRDFAADCTPERPSFLLLNQIISLVCKK